MDLIPRDFFDEDLFDNFMTGRSLRRNSNMKCDIYEKDGVYNIEMEVPGVKKEDIDIHEEDGYLTIAVKSSNEEKDESRNYLRRERYSVSCERKFYVGDINEDDIKAEFKDGMLKVSFKEVKQENRRRNITIE